VSRVALGYFRASLIDWHRTTSCRKKAIRTVPDLQANRFHSSNGTKRFLRRHCCDYPGPSPGFSGFFETSFSERPYRGLVDQEAHFITKRTAHAGRSSLPSPTKRITVPTPSPTSRAMRRIPSPFERMANAAFTFLAWLCSTVRRPSCFPSARARANPAITRSRIIARSNSANTPSIWNIARPEGVDVSSPC
jgi:hypothetical protein